MQTCPQIICGVQSLSFCAGVDKILVRALKRTTTQTAEPHNCPALPEPASNLKAQHHPKTFESAITKR